MQRPIQLFLATAVVVSLLVLNAAAFNDGLAGRSMGKRRMTNAERLARGLPPNPPAARYTPGVLRARDGASATTTSSSSSTTPSPTPPVTCPMTGYIVAFSDGTRNGYVAAAQVPNYADTSFLGYTADQGNAATVTFDTCSNNPVNMQCSNCADINANKLPYIGITIAGNMYNFTSDSIGYLGPLQQIPTGSAVDGSETAVWSFDNTTSSLTLTWANEDGSPVALIVSQVFLDSTSSYFVLYNPDGPGIDPLFSFFFEEQS